MEDLILDKDITVFYVTASSFPEGITEAHHRLHKLTAFSGARNYFGISRPENGAIVYRAGAEEKFEGEGKKLNCDTLVLKKGKYIFNTIHNYLKDPQQISKTFNKLLKSTDIDPDGYCVEWYINDKDVKCMVRLT
jgi:hypothetical protein